jgi:hypothetical protein
MVAGEERRAATLAHDADRFRGAYYNEPHRLRGIEIL